MTYRAEPLPPRRAPLDGEVLGPEEIPDEHGYVARPLCPFCSKPWGDAMMDVYVSSGGGGCDTCGYGGEGSATIDIECDGCGRLIYRKEFHG